MCVYVLVFVLVCMCVTVDGSQGVWMWSRVDVGGGDGSLVYFRMKLSGWGVLRTYPPDLLPRLAF